MSSNIFGANNNKPGNIFGGGSSGNTSNNLFSNNQNQSNKPAGGGLFGNINPNPNPSAPLGGNTMFTNNQNKN